MKGVLLYYPDGSDIVNVRIKLPTGWASKTSGTCRTMAEAKKALPRIIAEVYADHGIELPKPGGKKDATPGSSFRLIFLEEVETHIVRQKLRSPTPYRQGALYINQGLKKHADDPPKEQKPVHWASCRKYLLGLVESEKMAARTLETYLKAGREVLKRNLVKKGLPEECLAELERLPLASKGSSEASGLPFSKAQLEVIFELEPDQSDKSRILTWLGASGGLQVGDAVFFEFAFVLDWETGHIRGRRVKTKEIYEFVALPPLLALLRKRRDQLGPKAIFALPELIFDAKDLSKANGNTVRWKVIPEEIVKNGTIAGIAVVNGFLNLCKIKSKAITQKSWRKLMISVWATLGLREKVRMRMAGHRTLEEHLRYDTPAEFIFNRTADVVWRMFCAIRDRKPFFIPTTVFDVYDALKQDLEKLPERFQEILGQGLGPVHKKLDEGASNIKALHEKVDQLQIANQRLEQKLDRILEIQICLPGHSEEQDLVLQ